MVKIKPGGARPSVDIIHNYIKHFGADAVATDGVQYSPVATVGTTAVEILNELVDPGCNMYLHELEVHFKQRFEGLNGSFVGSISYFWEVQPDCAIPSAGHLVAFTGPLINVTGTIQKGVGTLTTNDDYFEGYIPVGSVPYAPVRVKLTATGLRASVVTGKVHNDSYIRLYGPVIPNT